MIGGGTAGKGAQFNWLSWFPVDTAGHWDMTQPLTQKDDILKTENTVWRYSGLELGGREKRSRNMIGRRQQKTNIRPYF